VSQEKYIGMDVHQATISAAVMDAQGKLHWSRPEFFVEFSPSQADSCLAHQSFLSAG